MDNPDLLAPDDAARGLSEDELRRCFPRVAAAPGRILGRRGDHDLNPGWGEPPDLRDAAVLVPLVARADGFTVLLTQRTAHLAAHAGQISFPGGAVEPEDANEEAAALRETWEEIGLPAERIELLGRLDTYVTRTGFRIAPVVGLIRPPFILKTDPYEVAEAFEVPLAVFRDPARAETHGRVFAGRERFFYAFTWEGRYIWGATAGMLVNLRDRLA